MDDRVQREIWVEATAAEVWEAVTEDGWLAEEAGSSSGREARRGSAARTASARAGSRRRWSRATADGKDA